eukprot:CAMPEP_0195007184 /NCGR_PEP_ID=MMETSP0326_2-20130528/7409_1 /TAXON_ID=2866 ORGANISM="Crypthecodinium cohnii, Strain Seligo" /NCGR_SAMPLE_ID=MMETSP0326_2 /ASSEMBLY_ACC=CAM_ASM_000348 /LENGTH=105 /DNA_ID=CAMNT_0040014417 /DNA_START=334 /DNA_END=651 /DNA_ORIENTATION=-
MQRPRETRQRHTQIWGARSEITRLSVQTGRFYLIGSHPTDRSNLGAELLESSKVDRMQYVPGALRSGRQEQRTGTTLWAVATAGSPDWGSQAEVKLITDSSSHTI